MAHQARFFGVVRHAERADAPFSFTNKMCWCVSEDAVRWPFDPPLSDGGLRGAPNMARVIQDFAGKDLSRLTIVSSPYLGCIQTAALICQAMDHKGRLLVDLALGELYGSAAFGVDSAPVAARPLEDMAQEGVPDSILQQATVLGEWPQWPEDLRGARRRYAARFLKYLSVSYKKQRDFLLVTHADCVATALTMMPSHSAQVVARVGYGGMLLAKSQGRWRFAPPVRQAQAQRLLCSVVRCGGSRTPPEEQADDDEDLVVDGCELDEVLHVPSAASEGWEVQPHGIRVHAKGQEQSGVDATRRSDSRIRFLSRGSDLTAENIEQLINGMGPSPLGDPLEPRHLLRAAAPRQRQGRRR